MAADGDVVSIQNAIFRENVVLFVNRKKSVNTMMNAVPRRIEPYFHVYASQSYGFHRLFCRFSLVNDHHKGLGDQLRGLVSKDLAAHAYS